MIILSNIYPLYIADNLLVLEAEIIKKKLSQRKESVFIAYPCRNYIRGVFYLLEEVVYFLLLLRIVMMGEEIISYD